MSNHNQTDPNVDFFRQWTTDDEGRKVFVGLSLSETTELLFLQKTDWDERVNHRRTLGRNDRQRMADLWQKREFARLKRIGNESVENLVAMAVDEQMRTTQH